MSDSKIKIDFTKNSVSETLLIPLIVKAKETKRNDAIISDAKAVEILNMLEIVASNYDGGSIAHHGILTRTDVLDKSVKAFLHDYPDGIVINLGAGLDTRITRVDNGKVRWFDVDLLDVIEIRKKFFEETERLRFIPKSVLDESWVNDIIWDKDDAILIIAEGLLMYFKEDELKTIFRIIIESFPTAIMYFDVVHSFFVGKGISSKFTWGIEKARDVEKIDSRIKLVKSWSVGDFHKNRQELFFRIMNMMPSTRNRSQILQVQFYS